jgi:RimJ/RimL family protein N-acetyltransferase
LTVRQQAAAGEEGMIGTLRFDEIQTERLLLRRWRDSDREPFAALNSDPQTMMYFPSTLDRAASDAFVDQIEARFEEQGFGLWALEVASDGGFIGYTGLNPLPPGMPGGGGMEIGWRLDRRAWHRGYATEAARAALNIAFDGAGLSGIWSMTAVLNEPSQAVMRRIGLIETARFDHPGIPAGHRLAPHVMYHLARPSGASAD